MRHNDVEEEQPLPDVGVSACMGLWNASMYFTNVDRLVVLAEAGCDSATSAAPLGRIAVLMTGHIDLPNAAMAVLTAYEACKPSPGLVDWLNHGDLTADPLVRAAMAHLNLVKIHPWTDGNGRMSRSLQTLLTLVRA